MWLYRLEETTNITDKKPYRWRACQLEGYSWRVIVGSSEDKGSLDKWMDGIYKRAALQLGIDTHSVKGFRHTYFIVREPWPEMVISDLINKVESLERKVQDLLGRLD